MSTNVYSYVEVHGKKRLVKHNDPAISKALDVMKSILRVGLFILFQVILTSVDNVTDIWSAVKYYLNGHCWWGISIGSLIFLPFVTSVFLEVPVSYLKGNSVTVESYDQHKSART